MFIIQLALDDPISVFQMKPVSSNRERTKRKKSLYAKKKKKAENLLPTVRQNDSELFKTLSLNYFNIVTTER